MEQYLKTEYDVKEDPKYLLTAEDIKEYYEEEGYELLDCGQGYYQDRDTFKVMTQDGKFYEVTIEAEIGSQKQDRGDRLYRVERITKVEYVEIEKPQPKPRTLSVFNFSLTADEDKFLIDFLNKYNIGFTRQ